MTVHEGHRERLRDSFLAHGLDSFHEGQALELLCAEARSNGITVLYDDIAIDNPAAALFLRHGFTEEARTAEKILLKKAL